MKILSRYMLREMVVPFLIGQCAIVMMLTGSVLYNNANLFIQYQVPAVAVVRLALYFIPFLVHMTMPVAMAVAASLAVSRLSRDSEITVMRAAGASLARIFMPIFMTGLIVSIGDFYFGEVVVPGAILRYQAVITDLLNHLTHLAPPSGQYLFSSDQKYAIGVREMIQRRGYIELHEVQILSGIKFFGEQAFVASANSGRYEDGKWTLYHPMLYSYEQSNPSHNSISTADKLIYDVPIDPQSFQSNFNLQMPMGQMASASTRTFGQIGEELKFERDRHITDYLTQLDYYFKLSVPFSCLVMAICCAPIALRFGRGGGFMGTLVAICLVFVYWNTLLLSRILGTPGPQGSTPLLQPAVAAWSQNVLFTLLGLMVLRKSE